jgi:1-acyl-sn-glycerol-3-phosphate acyltransferase
MNVRTAVSAILDLALRIFFRRVVLVGAERVGSGGDGVIIVLNHPNALIDPLFLMCRSPRPVSFMAKEPLFRMPFIGFIARALDCLPVYRHMDNADTTKNRETFQRAQQIVVKGGAIALFPEGTTHSDPHLRPLKTGAARLAIGMGRPVRIVPAGLYYEAKKIFRSKAMVYFGEPLAVEPGPLDEHGEPPREAVLALSERIRAALEEVTLSADAAETLQLMQRAERILAQGPTPLEQQFETLRTFSRGYGWFKQHQPQRLAAVVSRIRAYEADLDEARLTPETLEPHAFDSRNVTRYVVQNAARFAAVGLPALLGALMHYPAYRLIGEIARGRDDTVVSTVKMCGAMLLFPLTWALTGALVGRRWGVGAGMTAAAVAPACGYAALLAMERWERVRAAARAFRTWLLRRDFFAALVAEREAIRVEIGAMGETWQGSSPQEPSDVHSG